MRGSRRPHRFPTRQRPHVVKVNLNEEELAAVRTRAERYGRGNLSGYLRNAGVERCMPPLPAPPPAINTTTYGELARSAANLNQLVKHLNAGNVLAGPDVRDLKRTLAELHTTLQAARRELLGMGDAG